MTKKRSANHLLIPRNVLFGNPEKIDPLISPDGKRIAYRAPHEGVMNIWVQTVGERDARVFTRDVDRGIRTHFWAYDNKNILYVQDVGGDENWHLYAVNVNTGWERDLTPFDNVKAQVIARSKHHPKRLLVGLNKENPELHDVYSLHLTSGRLKKVVANPGSVGGFSDSMGWVADAHLRVLGYLRISSAGGKELRVRDGETEEWRTLISWSSEDSRSSDVIGFNAGGTHIYIKDSRDFNAGRLLKIELASGEAEIIAEDPHYDVGDVMMHPDTRATLAVSFVRARKEWRVLDESIRADMEVISNLHRGDFGVISRSADDQLWMVAFTTDDRPASFYLYDRQSKEGKLIFHSRPALFKYNLCRMRPISFKARDGLIIHGYLTLPRRGSRPYPMVLNVHGGPWGRDVWGYDPEVQWLANRGYACLQVNFRGSTGYGKQFVNAGDREWGAKMHDDLIDAVDWAVQQGYADPKRVAIFGGSYGGYAALVGAAFTPDIFCCAVDIVGPSNLVTLLKSVPPYWIPLLGVLRKGIGDENIEEDFVWSRSPLSKVDQIKIPMLIAQGANDPRVKRAESEQIVEAMREKGIDYEYMLFEDEGHGFAKPENRMKFYKAAEKFLAKHLGGTTED